MAAFKSRWTYRYDPKTGKSELRVEDTISDVVRLTIESADSERGALEDLHAKIDKLTEIVGVLSNQLPTAAKAELADILGWTMESEL